MSIDAVATRNQVGEYPVRIVRGTEAVVADLAPILGATLLSAEGCLVLPLSGRECLRPVSSGDSYGQRVINVLRRQGAEAIENISLGTSFIQTTSTETGFFAATSLSRQDMVVYRALQDETDLIKGYMRKWGLGTKGLDPKIPTTLVCLPNETAHAAVAVLDAYPNLPVAVSEPVLIPLARIPRQFTVS